MSENPLMVAGMLAATAVFFWMWLGDFRAARAGAPNPRALPGASGCGGRAIAIAVAGALVLLALETGGEYALGISGEQKTITVLVGIYTLAAAFIEEIVFRGYLVVENRGRAALWLGALGFSAVFALIHEFLWVREGWSFTLTLTPKGWFSTAAVFAGSMWFYAVRFFPANPSRSLIPCVAAHLAKNLGVFAIKAATGFVSGWW